MKEQHQKQTSAIWRAVWAQLKQLLTFPVTWFFLANAGLFFLKAKYINFNGNIYIYFNFLSSLVLIAITTLVGISASIYLKKLAETPNHYSPLKLIVWLANINLLLIFFSLLFTGSYELTSSSELFLFDWRNYPNTSFIIFSLHSIMIVTVLLYMVLKLSKRVAILLDSQKTLPKLKAVNLFAFFNSSIGILITFTLISIETSFDLSSFFFFTILMVSPISLILANRNQLFEQPWATSNFITFNIIFCHNNLVILFILLKNSNADKGNLLLTWVVIWLIMHCMAWLVPLKNKWHQALVQKVSLSNSALPTIQEKGDNHIDQQGFAASIIDLLQSTASGAVIGITGIRGAGKSTLLNTITNQLKPNYRVLNMTSPSHKAQEMSFFMTVCRNLCREVQHDAKQIIYGPQTPRQKASEENNRRMRIWLLFICIILTSVFSFYQVQNTGYKTWLQEYKLEQLRLKPQTIKQSEKAAINDLLMQIELLLQSNTSTPTTNGAQDYILKWGTLNSGLTIHPYENDLATTKPIMSRSKYPKNSVKPSKDIEYDTRANFGKEESNKMIEPALLNYYRFILSNYFTSESRSEFTSYLAEDIAETHRTIKYIESFEYDKADFQLYAQQLRNVLKSTRYNRDRQDRPIHYLPAWVLTEAIAEKDGLVKLNVEQLQKLKVILPKMLAGLNQIKDHSQGQSSNQAKPPSIINTTFALITKDWLTISFTIVVLLLIFGRWIWQQFSITLKGLANPQALALLRASDEFLDLLAYKADHQQSAGIKNRALSFTQTIHKKSRDLTLPGLTAYFAEYTQLLAKYHNDKVIIAIDELDKIHDVEQVKSLLSEIKGALSLPNCYYLLTISEDCAESFRKRLSGGRDIFESSFDEIYHVSRLSFDSVNKIAENLRGHKTGQLKLSEDNCRVILLFNGGIAREIVRAIRVLLMDKVLGVSPSQYQLALLLLRAQWQDWTMNLGELPTTGIIATQLHQHSYNAQQQIQYSNTTSSEQDLKLSISCIEQSLQLLDPENIRGDIIWTQPPHDSQQNEVFTAQLSSFQTLIRLKMLTKLSLWLCQNKSLQDLDESMLLECFKVLQRQPALAEHLIQQIFD